MYNLEEFLSLLDSFAPLRLSNEMINKGAYDNSGIIVKSHDRIEKILFTIDLSQSAVERAKSENCDTIVTHHPAIYAPISNLGVTNDTRALLDAVKFGLNVISMHLNLDVAPCGIDHSLSLALKGKNQKILDVIEDGAGYGREAIVAKQEIEDFVSAIKCELKSENIIFYGKGKVEKIASFCGSGSSDAVKQITQKNTDADTVITSDVPHHNLLALIESGVKVVIVPHYVAENYGFYKFYQSVSQKLEFGTQAYYFTDKRFM